MTLRSRLTATFLAVVLGPVLVGALFVGTTVTTLGHDRAQERMATAAGAVRAELTARCDRLTAAAASAALTGSARYTVEAGLASTVLIFDRDERVIGRAGPDAPETWSDCVGIARAGAVLGARVERHDTKGALIGSAVAIAPVDLEAVARGAGVAVGAGAHTYSLEPGPGQPLRLVLATDPPPPYRLYAVLVLVVTLSAVFALVAAWWLAGTTTRPLRELMHAAERVAAGDLDTRVPALGSDEVGRLGATFNRMTRETRAHLRALTASRDQLRGYLGLLGDTLSGTHDLGRILHVTLHTARAATAARSGVVMLYDPTTRMLVAQCAIGPLDVGGLRLKVGEGLLGTVAEQGLPVRGVGDHPLAAPDEPRGVSYVAVPFAAPAVESGVEAARGVLALYDRVGPDGFDAADVDTLTTFAAQAAVALDNVRLHEEAQRLSLTDPLTGLFNYRYLRESLRRELERAARFGRTLAVLALDLDHFKDVNDTYGHGAGDVVLAEVARRIRAVTREVDFAFRRGGEEFVVLLPETDAAGGAALAQRLGAALRDTPVLAAGAAITVTVSTGVAVYPDNGATGTAVLEAADVALYAAKAGGRDDCRVAPALGPAPQVTGASWAAQPSLGGWGG